MSSDRSLEKKFAGLFLRSELDEDEEDEEDVGDASTVRPVRSIMIERCSRTTDESIIAWNFVLLSAGTHVVRKFFNFEI